MENMELWKMFRTLWLLLAILVIVRPEPETQLDVSKGTPGKTALAADQPLLTGSSTGRLKCYACTDCERVLYNTTVKTCPYHTNNSKMHKCVTFVEKYKYLGKPWYVRGCASERGTCTEIQKAHENGGAVELTSCNECEGERCNGVSRSLPMAFLTFVMTPILAKLALS